MDKIETTGMSTILEKNTNDVSYKQTKSKGITTLIKYFETKYEITDIIKIDSRISHDLIKQKSFSGSKMLTLFFEKVLDYYHKNSYVPIDYSSMEPVTLKLKLIENIYKLILEDIEPDLFKKLFDLVDFMFKTIKSILIKIEQGYEKWIRSINTSLSSSIFPNLDILFYITFYPVFPEELRDVLHTELRLNETEYKIIKKCNDQIIRGNSNVCNTGDNSRSSIEINDFSKFDFISDEQKSFLQKISPTKSTFNNNLPEFPLNTQTGVMMLFSIILKLRNFQQRRKSRMDSI